MGQILHGSAKTTHAVRAAIQRSRATIAQLAERYDLNPKTVMKWRRRQFVEDMPMGPQDARSSALTVEEEALCAPSASTRSCRSTTVSMPCRRAFHT
jgi:transposase-like protein